MHSFTVLHVHSITVGTCTVKLKLKLKLQKLVGTSQSRNCPGRKKVEDKSLKLFLAIDFMYKGVRTKC